MAVAFDNPIPGWRTPTVSNLRLWDAEPITEFDLEAFNAGEYDQVSFVLGGDLAAMQLGYSVLAASRNRV